MVEAPYEERTIRNTHLENYFSAFCSRALYFQYSQVIYAKEKKPIQVVLWNILYSRKSNDQF